MDRTDLLADPRFADNAARVANADQLDAVIQEWMAARPLNDILARLEQDEAVVGPVYQTPRILSDPQYQARENVTVVHDPELGAIPMPGIVPKFSRTPGHIRHAGPRLGEHNNVVYGELLGLSPDELASLAGEGVI